MVDLELCYTPATELAKRIRSKQLSPVELVKNSLARIEQVNPKINCFCFVFPDEAIEQAKKAEAAVMRGDKLGPIHGIPVAIKDLTPTKGKRTTLGSYAYENWVPDFNATVVDSLLNAGGIMVGKTTTPEFAYASVTWSPLWGVTGNPWNPEKTPGGSSGGSGGAVASGCVPLAEGTDMGGSVRIPAAWCGTVGLKPSLGRIPQNLLTSVFDNISHFGPLTRTIDDARLMMKVVQGPDERDIQSIGAPLDFDREPSRSVKGMRFAYDMDLGCYYVDPEVARVIGEAIDALKKAGATVEEVSLPWTRRTAEFWVEMWQVFMSGYFGQHLEKFRNKMDPNIVKLIEAGNKISATQYKRIEIERTAQWNSFYPILQKYDAFFCPTMPVPPIGAKEDDYVYYGHFPDGLYHGIDMTAQFNSLAPCPALSVPAGWDKNGLPVGLQIVTQRWRDDKALEIGAALEAVRPWAQRRPPI